ncbi:probable G-protein coupled receptor 21 [Lytechinus pictus]|uniref:probable G-protein coupled receptor 21 n=1 Tax=Lytechinus pictus TaxID=7653 RepID=UPI0030BA0E51
MAMGLFWNSWSVFWFWFNDARTCSIINKFLPYFHRVTALSILGSVCLICWDRYVMITRPLRYPALITLRRVVITLSTSFCFFVIACGFYLPFPGFGFADIFIRNCIKETWTFAAETWKDLFMALFIVIPIFSTLVIMTLTNLALLRVAYRQSRAIAAVKTSTWSDNAAPASSVSRPSYNKSVKTVVLLTFPFYICWLPWIMFLTFQDVFGTADFLDAFGPAASWIRPIIYMITTKEARKIIYRKINKRDDSDVSQISLYT